MRSRQDDRGWEGPPSPLLAKRPKSPPLHPLEAESAVAEGLFKLNMFSLLDSLILYLTEIWDG